jgi:hypothetical protein
MTRSDEFEDELRRIGATAGSHYVRELAKSAAEHVRELSSKNAELRAGLKPFGRYEEVRREMGGYFPTGTVFGVESSVAGRAELCAEDFAKALELTADTPTETAPALVVDPGKLPHSVLSAICSNIGCDDPEENLRIVEKMTPERAFEAYCTWKGLIGWSRTLADALDAIRAAAKPKP